MQRKYDLNERLIAFASSCIDVAESLPKTVAGNHISSQLVRSSTSPALNYGEAQGAESMRDFIHKLKVCLKELRETMNNLQLILFRKWYDEIKLAMIIKENNELVAIFVASLKTAKKKLEDQNVSKQQDHPPQ
jgi:four helix bundle protein